MTPKKLKTVYIVEDSSAERTMLTDHLAKYPDLEIKEFSTGDSCVKELVLGNIEEPDLILMDYFLDTAFGASKDGLETLSKLKEICPDTKVIMLTSVDNEKIIELAKKKGALDY
ncbi:MAG: response regulator, partial [Bacteroidia bacterium]|nr:response regulator [Bacteroidia bacterium]